MKKRYEKPQLLIENFTLTESIAGCEEVNLVEVMHCKKTDPILDAEYNGHAEEGIRLFGGELDCEWSASLVENGGGWKICYHTSTSASVSVFNS